MLDHWVVNWKDPCAKFWSIMSFFVKAETFISVCNFDQSIKPKPLQYCAAFECKHDSVRYRELSFYFL